MTETIKQASAPAAALDPTEAVEDLLRSLKSHTEGLSSREAQRRLSLAGFFAGLTQAGWHSGDPTGAHTRFHHAYQQATTMTFLGVIFGQIGTAFAVRTRRASLRSVGVFSNRYLLWAIAGELAIAAVFVFAPPCQALLGTAVPPGRDLLLLIPFPFIVWGADELRKWVIRTRSTRRAAAATSAPA
jgi:magnesium-transporting ATPase (P-type)